MPTLLDAAIGLVTNFFDTLGIGSFATTSSLFRFWGLVRDEQLPGTLNVGHAFPSILQAFIYIAVVQVDVVTLTLMIAAAVMGAWLGAGVVSRWPRRKVQIGMGIALLTAATVLLLTQLQLLPGGGDRLGLTGARLLAAVAANSVLGALMTMGIGLYAPCMMLIFLLGMTPRAAFPIMMGSCAFLMPVGSVQFIRRGSYNLKAALGLSLGGVPGVLLAAFLVKSLPLGAIRWLVMAAVVYTAVMMLRSAVLERQQAEVAAMPASSSAK
ncbi:MAG: sulfite exporter TauE/SafE family protein [Acidobacteria bacterium]|nr:sulfite exporter TauE/SafE family protein [Acidobacteriota bacterium]